MLVENGAVIVPAHLAALLFQQIKTPKHPVPRQLGPIMAELAQASADWSIRRTQTVELENLRAFRRSVEKMPPVLGVEVGTDKASELLNCSPRRVRQLLGHGHLTARRVGKTLWVSVPSIERYRRSGVASGVDGQADGGATGRADS